VTGNLDDGTWANDLLDVLQGRGLIVNKAVRGGRFGEQVNNAHLVNADSPKSVFLTQGSSDDPSTTSTTTTAPAATATISLTEGKWAFYIHVSIHLSHSTGSSSVVEAEIEGGASNAHAVSSVGTSGMRCEAYLDLTAEADWVQGEQDFNIRARFRSSAAGTTSAKNPSIIAFAWRME
jgi:hypothetical protein